MSLHAGSRILFEEKVASTEEERLGEEDPRTDEFCYYFPNHIVAHDSRFAYDLNRCLEGCIYRNDKSFGVPRWKEDLTIDEINLLKIRHINFYKKLEDILGDMTSTNSFGIVLDFHSYNTKIRNKNPDINIGTGCINISTGWADKIHKDRINGFANSLGGMVIGDRKLSVAQNEIFKGGYLNQFISNNYPGILVFSIEFAKKLFMSEETGEFNEERFASLKQQFQERVMEYLESQVFTIPIDNAL